TARRYGDDVAQVRALLAGQLARPVEFVREMENMYAAGIRTFVETGPSNIITGLVGKILADHEHYAIALDASKGRRSGQYDLALLLARLSTLGYHCDISRWDAGYLATLREEKQPALTIPISGANYVQPRERSQPLPRPAQARSEPAPPASVMPRPVPATVPVPVTPTAVNDNSAVALQAIQQGILSLQKLQEQTAQLHKQYLDGQENAQRTIQQLLLQQQQLITGVPVTAVTMPVPPIQTVSSTYVAQEQPATPAKIEQTQPATDNQQPSKSNTQYKNILLEVVAEKTGYPVDMLSLDMSLDTDLGIDSIKRVEILAALQEKLPGIQKIQPEELGTFQLLQHIVEYLADGDRTTSVIAERSEIENPSTSGRGVGVREGGVMDYQKVLLEVVAAKTGYLVDMLNLDMNLDTDLGIDSIKRVEILAAFQERLPDAPAVQPDELGRLQTLRQIVEFMGQSADHATAPAAPVVTGNHEPMQQTLLEVVAAKTGYPVDMLNLD
ncbi:MAG TPA: phosphopantetheine-binding protein, partial [Candidatus Glassbacteria bacterium]|nr:phosphopantetheine-binding protein [Candidatus Glassbacteria bacterium]